MLPDSFTDVLKEWDIAPNARLLLAVSGGMDSMVLMHMAQASEYAIGVAHMNFSLRGSDADEDLELVKHAATSQNIPFHFKEVNTKNYATDHNVSIQVAARELRYRWFAELMREHRYDYLLTAHHLNDSLETSLFHFTKGGSLASLRGIPDRTESILRPLLTWPKGDIEQYARDNNIVWRDDASNEDDKYLRNFLRLHVVPKLKEVNPSLEKSFYRNQQRLSAALQLVRQEALARLDKYSENRDGTLYLDKAAFSDGNLAVAEELLGKFGFTFSQIEDLMEVIRSGVVSRSFETTEYLCVADRSHLVITNKTEKMQEVKLDVEGGTYKIGGGTINIFQSSGPEILSEKFAVSFDADKVGDSLILRPWRQGDRIQPLGMQGKKKVSDLMIDEKIPLNLKNRVWVLEASGALVWVLGLRISEKFKVGPNSSRILNIVFEHDQPI